MEGDSPFVSTGELPPADLASRLVAEAHERYRSTADGAVSEVYPVARARAAGPVRDLRRCDAR